MAVDEYLKQWGYCLHYDVVELTINDDNGMVVIQSKNTVMETLTLTLEIDYSSFSTRRVLAEA